MLWGTGFSGMGMSVYLSGIGKLRLSHLYAAFCQQTGDGKRALLATSIKPHQLGFLPHAAQLHRAGSASLMQLLMQKLYLFMACTLMHILPLHVPCIAATQM